MYNQKQPGIILSLIPVALLIILLSLNVMVYSDNSSFGPNQLALLFAAMVAAILGVFVLRVSLISFPCF